MKFQVELVRSSQKKKGLDNVYEVVFVTDNPQILDFGKFPADTLFKIDINLAPNGNN